MGILVRDMRGTRVAHARQPISPCQRLYCRTCPARRSRNEDTRSSSDRFDRSADRPGGLDCSKGEPVSEPGEPSVAMQGCPRCCDPRDGCGVMPPPRARLGASLAAPWSLAPFAPLPPLARLWSWRSWTLILALSAVPMGPLFILLPLPLSLPLVRLLAPSPSLCFALNGCPRVFTAAPAPPARKAHVSPPNARW